MLSLIVSFFFLLLPACATIHCDCAPNSEGTAPVHVFGEQQKLKGTAIPDYPDFEEDTE